MSLRTFLFGKDVDNNKGRPTKKWSDLYKVLFGENISNGEFYSDKEIIGHCKQYIEVANNVLHSCVEKMSKTHTPKVFFDSAQYAETMLRGVIVIEKYYPRLVKNAAKDLNDFLALRAQYFYAFADRFFVKVEKEFKQSQNRGRAELSRLAVYEKEMLPEERQYYTDKKSKL